MRQTPLASRGFDLVKGYLVPALEQFSFDLKTPLTQLSQLIEAGTPDDYRSDLSQALATLSAVPPAVASDRGLRVTLRMLVAPGIHVPTASRSATLTQADIDAWEKALDEWDAFVVFAVKQLGASRRDKELREDLLELLLDSRHRLVRVLAQPQRWRRTGPGAAVVYRYLEPLRPHRSKGRRARIAGQSHVGIPDLHLGRRRAACVRPGGAGFGYANLRRRTCADWRTSWRRGCAAIP